MKRLIGFLRVVIFILFFFVSVATYAAGIEWPVNSVLSHNSQLGGKYLYSPDNVNAAINIYDISGGSSFNPVNNKIGQITSGQLGGGVISAMALSLDGNTLYALATNGNVKMFGPTGTLKGTINGTTFVAPTQMAMSSDGKRLYVLDQAFKGVKIIDTKTNQIISSISVDQNPDVKGVSATYLFGIAISPDNTMLAVTNKQAYTSDGSGSAVYIYNIVHSADGTISYQYNRSLTYGSIINYPTHVVFSPDSKTLYVRVDQTSGSFRDIVMFNVTNNFSGSALSLENGNYQDPNNVHGEILGLSVNGLYIYATHRNSSGTNIVYRISTVNSDGTPRNLSNWTYNSAIDGSFTLPFVTFPADGLSVVPDGSYLWFTCSEPASAMYNAMFSSYTGYRDASGALVNKVPEAPSIVHPNSVSGDNLDNYAGVAQWAHGYDDSPAGNYKYEIYYKQSGSSTWTSLEGFTPNTTTSLATLSAGVYYNLRIRMYDGVSWWSPYTYSEPFKKPNATISTIEIDKNRDPNVENFTEYNASTNIGYIYDAIKIKGTGFGSLSSPFSYNGTDYQVIFRTATKDYILPAYIDENSDGQYNDGEEHVISNWQDSELSFVMPEEFKDKSAVYPQQFQLVVKSFGVEGAIYSFNVGPVVTDMNRFGYPGQQVDIYGAGFGATKGTSSVIFNSNATAQTSYWDNGHITCTVPSGVVNGRVKVKVNNVDTSINYAGAPLGDGQYNLPVTFEVLPIPQPTYTSVKVWDIDYDSNGNKLADSNEYKEQTWGYDSDAIIIKGNNFGSAGTVKLGTRTIPSEEVYWATDGTQISFSIPSTAVMGHPGITITNTFGSLTIPFDIHPKIDNNGISPASGLPGTRIYISGTGFNDSTLINSIDFLIDGNIAASVAGVLEGGKIHADVPNLLINTYNVRIASEDFDGIYSNDNQTFTLVNPKITGFAVDTDPHPVYDTWKDLGPQDSVAVNDNIKIKGSGFGSPGDGAGDTASYNVTFNGIKIRDDDVNNTGYQIYSWNDNEIKLGIPHKAGNDYIKSGNNVVVVTAGDITATSSIKIRPTIDRYLPDDATAHKGSSVVLVGTALESLSLSQVVHFGDSLIGNGVIARAGETPADVDGSDVTETLTFNAPDLPPASYSVSVEGEGVFSNKVDFNIVAPVVSQIQVADDLFGSTPLQFSGNEAAYGYVYSSLKITGEAFGEEGTVKIGNIILEPNKNVWWDANKNEISVAVPRNIVTDYVDAGDKLSIINAYGEPINASFTVRPKISSLSKQAAAVGGSFSIKGYALGDAGDGDVVKFLNDTLGNEFMDVVVTSRDSDNDIINVILDEAVFASKTGIYTIEVDRNSQVSNSMQFNILPKSVPIIENFQVDTNPNPDIESFKDVTDGVVIYDTVKISGESFGAVADGSRATASNNITINGLMIPDVLGDPLNPSDPGNQGYQVYSWNDTEIVVGIPRSVTTIDGVKYINAGVHEIKVTANGDVSNSANLTIKPTINYVNPKNGYPGLTTVTISGEALVSVDAGSITKLYFGGVNLGTVTVNRGIGNSMDGRGAKDFITVKLPSDLPVGLYSVSAEVGSLVSVSKNDENLFNVLAIPVPAISSIQVKDDTWNNKYVTQSLDSAYGYVYSTVSVEGNGFDTSPGSRIVLNLSNGDIVDLPSDYIYAWENKLIEFGVPRVITIQPQDGPSQVFYISPGSATIELINRFGNKADLIFNIHPKIYSVSKSSVKAGDTMDVSGVGFGDPTNTVDITFWDATGTKVGLVEMSNGFVRTADNGDISGNDAIKNIVVPDLGASGTYTVKVSAYDDAPPYSNGKDVTFTATPGPQTPSVTKIEVRKDENSAYVTTSEGYLGYTVKMSGTGFEGNYNNQGKVMIDGVEMPIYSWNEPTGNGDGTYYISFGLARSVNSVYATAGLKAVAIINNVSKTSATVPFTIKPEITSSISPTNGYAGSKIKIYGTGFGATNDTVTVILNDGTTSVSTTGVATRVNDEPAILYDGYDQVETTVPAGLTVGTYEVVVVAGLVESNNDYKFTVKEIPQTPTPVITGLEVDTDTSQNNAWQATTDAVIYDHIRIVGTGFGNTISKGEFSTDTNNVTIAGLRIRDGGANDYDGLQVYSWLDNYIEIGIPRRIGDGANSDNFIKAGPNEIKITANGKVSNVITLNIKPYVYALAPGNGIAGDEVKIKGTALVPDALGQRYINFGSYTAVEKSFDQQAGMDPDGTSNDDFTDGNDVVTVTVPSGLVIAGDYSVSAVVSSLTSNIKTFTIKSLGAPKIIQVTPDVLLNTENITVIIDGENFIDGASVFLVKDQQPSITSDNVIVESSSRIRAYLPIKDKGAVIGKWNLVVTNPDTQTASKVISILDGNDPNNETAQVIDDFEGMAVKPENYTAFTSGGDINFALSSVEKHEGEQSIAVTYGSSPTDKYRGYNGYLSEPRDISDFTSVALWVKGDGSSGLVSLQLTDKNSNNFAAVDSKGDPKYTIPLTTTIWTKYVIPLSAFVQIKDGFPSGGQAMDKSSIANYQIVFKGSGGTTGTVYVDFVVAEGYIPPPALGDITTSIARSGSDISITWKHNDKYAGTSDIYTSNTFSTNANDWTIWKKSVASPQTDLSQVGLGTEKYYKVVKTDAGISSDMLKDDVVGKFDIKALKNLKYNLVSLPLIQSESNINSVIGNQMTGAPFEFGADSIYYPVGDVFEIAWLKDDGKWYKSGTTDTLAQISIDEKKGFYMVVNDTTGNPDKNVTIVGNVSFSKAVQTVSQGYNLVGSPYPVTVGLSSSGLFESGLKPGDFEFAASSIYYPNAQGGFDVAWLKSDGTWRDTGTDNITSIKLKPGVGYYLYDTDVSNSNLNFEWTYPLPY